MKRATCLFLAACGGLALFAGCVNFSRPEPDRRQYLFDLGPAPAPAARPLDATLEVSRFTVAPAFDRKELVYRRGGNEYATDFYHTLILYPGPLLADMVRVRLAAAGLFRNVVTPASRAEADYLLEGDVRELYGDFRDAAPTAVLELDFILLRAPYRQIVWHQAYRRAEKIARATPADLLSGWDAELRKILDQLATDLAAAVGAKP